MGTHTQPIDPQIASGTKPDTKCKVCASCHAPLPIACYGLNKYGRGGYDNICLECRAQYQRLNRQKKYGSKSKIDDSHIRSVAIHNKLVLDAALSKDKLEFRAFSYETGLEYKVFYGPSERIGLNSLALFTKDGSVFMEWALSGLKDPRLALLGYIQVHRLRLEYSDMAVLESKKLVYYILNAK